MRVMSTVPAEDAESLVTSAGSMIAGNVHLVGVQTPRVRGAVAATYATHTDQTTGITTIDQLSATCLETGVDRRASQAAVQGFIILVSVKSVESISKEGIC